MKRRVYQQCLCKNMSAGGETSSTGRRLQNTSTIRRERRCRFMVSISILTMSCFIVPFLYLVAGCKRHILPYQLICRRHRTQGRLMDDFLRDKPAAIHAHDPAFLVFFELVELRLESASCLHRLQALFALTSYLSQV